ILRPLPATIISLTLVLGLIRSGPNKEKASTSLKERMNKIESRGNNESSASVCHAQRKKDSLAGRMVRILNFSGQVVASDILMSDDNDNVVMGKKLGVLLLQFVCCNLSWFKEKIRHCRRATCLVRVCELTLFVVTTSTGTAGSGAPPDDRGRGHLLFSTRARAGSMEGSCRFLSGMRRGGLNFYTDSGDQLSQPG
ncbi:hypothetical protein Taro_020115, partial [Colocasia esculenta]|nr:hypothetical protein [Colocasia esculenta]